MEFIATKPLGAPPEVLPDFEAGVDDVQVDDEPQVEDDRAHRIAVDPGMDVDVVMDSIADLLPLVDGPFCHGTTSAGRPDGIETPRSFGRSEQGR